MNEAAFQLLAAHPEQEVALRAEPWDHFSGERPEVIILLPADVRRLPSERLEILRPGLKVRVNRAPYFSQIGTIVALRPGLTIFPSGMSAPAAIVRLDDDEVDVPLANVSVIVNSLSPQTE
jgi:hypothetical protein